MKSIYSHTLKRGLPPVASVSCTGAASKAGYAYINERTNILGLIWYRFCDDDAVVREGND